MSRIFGEKLKLLYIKDYLLAYTDEDHPASVNDIIEHLIDEHDIVTGRKGIYSDIKVLGKAEEIDENALEDDNINAEIADCYGMDLIKKNKGYYVGKRDFSIQEIKMLIDMVESSSNIPADTAKELVEKLQKFASIHSRKYLERHIDIRNQVKTLNDEYQRNADIIFAAIRDDKKIKFQYFSYGMNKKKELRRNGKIYEISPFALIWVDQNYYMIGYSSEALAIRTFRVDRMTKMVCCRKSREGKQEFEKMTGGNLPAFINKVFHMYLGPVKIVTMKFRKELVDTVIDRFGEDVMLHKDDENHFTVTTEVAVSPQFYGWLAGFGSYAELVSPNDERENMKKHLQNALDQYK